MKKKTLFIKHNLGQYPVTIGKGLLSDTEFFRTQLNDHQVLIVSNETVAELYLDRLKQALPQADRISTLLLPDGEQHKTLDSYQKIVHCLANKPFHRDDFILALGGGVIGDMAGFAAATYHRGIRFIQIPTTLLAQVDASIGGKTAVNLPQGKNLVGAFHQPQAVLIDIDTLATLPQRELKAACAEIIKAALIQDEAFFCWLEENLPGLLRGDEPTLSYAIERACAIKKDIVIEDEKEQGQRALLNLGHTFGHAIEQLQGYGQLLHGEAVAIGIVMAAQKSHGMGWLSQEKLTRIIDIFTQIDLSTELPSDIDYAMLQTAMLGDKKILDGKLRMILLKDIGQAVIVNLESGR